MENKRILEELAKADPIMKKQNRGRRFKKVVKTFDTIKPNPIETDSQEDKNNRSINITDQTRTNDNTQSGNRFNLQKHTRKVYFKHSLLPALDDTNDFFIRADDDVPII